MKTLITALMLAGVASTSMALDLPEGHRTDYDKVKEAYQQQYHDAWDWAMPKLKLEQKRYAIETLSKLDLKGSKEDAFKIYSAYANEFAYYVVYEGQDWNEAWDKVKTTFKKHVYNYDQNLDGQWNWYANYKLEYLEDLLAKDPWLTAKVTN